MTLDQLHDLAETSPRHERFLTKIHNKVIKQLRKENRPSNSDNVIQLKEKFCQRYSL